jgi:hypothetical protein
MPGSISDSYDPEWGTSGNASEIILCLDSVYDRVSDVLEHRDSKYILELIDVELPTQIPATLTEKEWRLIRFAIDRARNSI